MYANLVQFQHERRHFNGDAFRSLDVREEAVSRLDSGYFGGNEGTDVSHVHDQGYLKYKKMTLLLDFILWNILWRSYIFGNFKVFCF